MIVLLHSAVPPKRCDDAATFVAIELFRELTDDPHIIYFKQYLHLFNSKILHFGLHKGKDLELVVVGDVHILNCDLREGLA